MKLCDTFQSAEKVAKTPSTRNNVFTNFVPSYYPLLKLIRSVTVYRSGTWLSVARCGGYKEEEPINHTVLLIGPVHYYPYLKEEYKFQIHWTQRAFAGYLGERVLRCKRNIRYSDIILYKPSDTPQST